jgi:hypothetical protein
VSIVEKNREQADDQHAQSRRGSCVVIHASRLQNPGDAARPKLRIVFIGAGVGKLDLCWRTRRKVPASRKQTQRREPI